MPIGPGKYDPECEFVRNSTHALAALVIVIGGDRGNGFSMAAVDAMPPERVADVLEHTARELRASMKPQGSA